MTAKKDNKKKDPLLDEEATEAKAEVKSEKEPEPEKGEEFDPAKAPTDEGLYGNSKAAVSEGDKNAAFIEAINRTKEAMKKEPLVSIVVPLEPGEKEGTMIPVSINNYTLNIKKGCMVSVPKPFAAIIAESFKINLELGREMRIDRKADVQEALS